MQASMQAHYSEIISRANRHNVPFNWLGLGALLCIPCNDSALCPLSLFSTAGDVGGLEFSKWSVLHHEHTECNTLLLQLWKRACCRKLSDTRSEPPLTVHISVPPLHPTPRAPKSPNFTLSRLVAIRSRRRLSSHWMPLDSIRDTAQDQ